MLANDVGLAVRAGELLTELGRTVDPTFRSFGSDDFAAYCEQARGLMVFCLHRSRPGGLHDASYLPDDAYVATVADALIAGFLAALTPETSGQEPLAQGERPGAVGHHRRPRTALPGRAGRHPDRVGSLDRADTAVGTPPSGSSSVSASSSDRSGPRGTSPGQRGTRPLTSSAGGRSRGVQVVPGSGGAPALAAGGR